MCSFAKFTPIYFHKPRILCLSFNFILFFQNLCCIYFREVNQHIRLSPAGQLSAPASAIYVGGGNYSPFHLGAMTRAKTGRGRATTHFALFSLCPVNLLHHGHGDTWRERETQRCLWLRIQT